MGHLPWLHTGAVEFSTQLADQFLHTPGETRVTAAGLKADIRRKGVAGVIREVIAPQDMEAAE